jgi:hypothetical protein
MAVPAQVQVASRVVPAEARHAPAIADDGGPQRNDRELSLQFPVLIMRTDRQELVNEPDFVAVLFRPGFNLFTGDYLIEVNQNKVTGASR